MSKYSHTVSEEELGLSINQILRANFKFSSRFRTKMKYQSLVDLNGTPTPGYIKPEIGDVIDVRLPEEQSDFPAENIPLDVLYEDDDLLVINKQPGIIVHPTKGHPEHTIANAIMYYMQTSGQSFKVRFANRIDMDTSGIIICCKNANSQNDISNQMRHGTILKKYKALVHGTIDEDMTINLPVGRPSQESIQRMVMEGGKSAITDVHVLRNFENYTLVELTIHTGRTHQIRVHLTHIGHPIVGDELYGGEAPELIDRQALHAYHIEFIHPMNKEPLVIEAPLPEDINSAINSII
ncbi:MAG: RluA family pseudouridine synthase [Clostridiales bacterium]|nr:RluA family pseudouridine synthase [Candidatus Crickella caballi]